MGRNEWLCRDPATLMPYYFLIVSQCIKGVVTALVVGPDSITPLSEVPPWKKYCKSAFQCFLIALFCSTLYVDHKLLIQFEHQTWWQFYECGAVVFTTSSNLQTAWVYPYIFTAMLDRRRFMRAHEPADTDPLIHLPQDPEGPQDEEEEEEYYPPDIDRFERFREFTAAKGILLSILGVLSLVYIIFFMCAMPVIIIGGIAYFWVVFPVYYLTFWLAKKVLAELAFRLKRDGCGLISPAAGEVEFAVEEDTRKMKRVLRITDGKYQWRLKKKFFNIEEKVRHTYLTDIEFMRVLGTTSSGAFLPYQGPLSASVCGPLCVILSLRLVSAFGKEEMWNDSGNLDWSVFWQNYWGILCVTLRERTIRAYGLYVTTSALTYAGLANAFI